MDSPNLIKSPGLTLTNYFDLHNRLLSLVPCVLPFPTLIIILNYLNRKDKVFHHFYVIELHVFLILNHVPIQCRKDPCIFQPKKILF